MTNWFGASWGAPLCQVAPHCETPIGVLCLRCEEAFKDGDQGVTMPGDGFEPRFVVEPRTHDGQFSKRVAYHIDCHLKGIVDHKDWPRNGLVPNLNGSDGPIVDDVWSCETCGAAYSFTTSTWFMNGERVRPA